MHSNHREKATGTTATGGDFGADRVEVGASRGPRRTLCLFACMGIAAAVAGCQMSNIVPYPDQEAAILEIAPLGTPRGEVASRLKEAGIKYEPSAPTDAGVFYCETWEMEPGEEFHLFCELLFDESGRLQEIRETPNNFPQ